MTPKPFDEIIRQAFRDSGMSILQFTKLSQTQYGSTYGFLHGADCKLKTAEKLARALGLELRRVRMKPQARKGK